MYIIKELDPKQSSQNVNLDSDRRCQYCKLWFDPLFKTPVSKTIEKSHSFRYSIPVTEGGPTKGKRLGQVPSLIFSGSLRSLDQCFCRLGIICVVV